MKKRGFLGAAIILFSLGRLFADVPFALLGGKDNNSSDAYGALLSSSGSLEDLFGLPVSVKINSVAINNEGVGIVGGGNFGAYTPYAAFAFPNRSTSSLLGLPVSGIIFSVAINDTGVGVLGGSEGLSDPFAGIAFPGSIAVTPLSGLPATGTIHSVAINQDGASIIGGEMGGSMFYAAVVLPNTTAAIPVSGLPLGGAIYGVGINNFGTAIIGGHTDSSNMYAAFIPAGSFMAVPVIGFPPNGRINATAINDSGNAIIGGYNDLLGDPYAALISASGEITSLSGWVGFGEIYSVAINNSGEALIGGVHQGAGEFPYAALVAPNGTTKNLSGSIGEGKINSVAINEAGVGIIGGIDHNSSTPFAALVAPNGTTTNLSGWIGEGEIDSVAINAALGSLVPASFGSGNSYMNSLIPVLDLLSDHLKHPLVQSYYVADHYLAAAKEMPLGSCCKKIPYTVWGGIVGAQAIQRNERQIAKVDNWIGGAVLGFDYRDHRCPYSFCVGGAVAYTFNFVRLSDGEGHAKIYQELLSTYGTYQESHFLLEAALWVGLYQTSNHRHSLGFITSTSNYHGWLLVPHLELNTPFEVYQKEVILSPFVRLDWANNWQGEIREKGASGFNLRIDRQHASLLRSEVGLRFFEKVAWEWGQVVFEEKLSYVNKKPFGSQPVSTFFAGSVSSFSIETFSSAVQNLGAAQLGLFFLPSLKKYPYGELNYQIEIGSHFILNELLLELGKQF